MKSKEKKIVFINQSPGYLMIDILNAFAESGNYEDIALIAGKIRGIERLNRQVKISRIKSYKIANIRQRLTSWIVGTIQSLFIIWWKYRGFHLFLVSNPPTISFITLLCRNSYSTLIYDVYPEGLVLGGFVSRKSLINKIWSRFNQRFYENAQHVFTITDGMAEGIKSYCSNVKVQVIPVWSGELKEAPKDKISNKFITLYSLQDKFIVMYSGNMGKGHDIEVLVQVANNLKEDKDIVFIFIGEGWKKTLIKDLIQDMNLNNCIVLPYQSAEMLPHSLSAADLGVVFVPVGAGNVCVPSKTYNLLPLGVPVMGIAEKNSEIYQLIEKHNIGACFFKDNIKEISEFIYTLKNKEDEKMKYKHNSIIASVHYTPANAYHFVYAFNL